MSVRRAPAAGTVRGVRLSRYDLYLALLPVPLLVGVVVALATDVSLPYGTGLGSLLSAGVLAYGLFVDAPTGGRKEDERNGRGGRGTPADG